VKEKQTAQVKDQPNDDSKINIQDKALNNKVYTLEFIFSFR
jgi:hypothetical protein